MDRISAVPNNACSSRSPMQMNNGTMPSMFPAVQFAVHGCGNLMYLKESLEVGDRKYLLIKFWPAPVFITLPAVKKALDVAPIEILT